MTRKYIIISLALTMAVLAVCNLLWGSLTIPPLEVLRILTGKCNTAHASWEFIVWESRIPQMLTSMLCGAALSTCGLMLQTLFRNPLAGPSILGIDAGANLGVALVMLLLGGSMTMGSLNLSGYLLITLAAMFGACCILLLLLSLSHYLRNQIMLLITGVIIGYVTSSVISILNFNATEEGVHNYIIWGMGNFSSVSLDQLPLFSSLIGLGLCGAAMLIKPLDALLLGEEYAMNLGVNIRLTRKHLLVCTGLLTATTTAFCGPISFLGLAVPHIARLIFKAGSHRLLLPGTMLIGSCMTLLCNLICNSPSNGSIIPINVITPLIGAPIILYVILKKG